MGLKLLWIGLTMIVAITKFWPSLPWDLLGALLMIIGVILLILDK